MFTKEDLKQIQKRGSDIKTIEQQIQYFKTGFPKLKLIRPAIVGDGIKTFNQRDAKKLSYFYDSNSKRYEVMKFVPASGAASRMFKMLFEFLNENQGKRKGKELIADEKYKEVKEFFDKIENFAFYNKLEDVMKSKGVSLANALQKHDYSVIIEHLLLAKGLNYASLPKGLILFHKDDSGSLMAIEEQMVEAAHYCKGKDKRAAIHFTVSPEHADFFLEEINRIKSKYEDMFEVVYELTFSLQKSSTDTIAVDIENKPFRDENGQLVFRPGGHGALIENLNDRESEIVFIKNIDNIVPDKLKDSTYLYKKILGGYLFELQDAIFEHIETLQEKPDDEDIRSALRFIKTKLGFTITSMFNSYEWEDKIEYLLKKLNRPIRVCGMVKNEGEPGGGPFWVENEKEEISLQIIESSQVDTQDKEQNKIFESATHFNPVDIVCGVRDYQGKVFDLLEYIDPNMAFISKKSKDGKELKALELPGLWNGAMADWITVFVEVPVETFNPVKTVNDLLRPQHQPE